ncbi:MAG: DEAD/DEAH box helicase [Alphaproteobacteria bacterium]
MTFDELGLGPDVLKAVADAGYHEPTPIQLEAIPVALQGRDILGCAQTGTGKTAAFTLPMIEILSQGQAKARMSRSLVLSPTRELAMQTAENFEIYGKYHSLTMALLIGGVTLDEQTRKLERGVDVLIATPGRLLDHFERGALLLNGVKVLVIDEADRMLDMGFMPDVERIVGLLPGMRQTLMFSATMPLEVRRLADKFLHNPKEIRVDPPASPADMVEHALVRVAPRTKRKMLEVLLAAPAVRNALIFCNRKREVADLARALKRDGLNATALHGDMDQASRIETLDSFRRGDVRFLVATDVAGRGLDIFGLSHVFNFDVPIRAEDYVHRIGRTGRAGHRGHAITLVATSEDERAVRAIESLIRRPLPVIDAPGAHAPPPHAKTPSPPRPTSVEKPAEARRPPDRATRKPAEARRPPDHDTRKPAEVRRPPDRDTRKPAEARRPPDRDAKKPKPAAAARRRHDADEPDRPVVGLGSHVPAFLLRPVALAAHAEDDEEKTEEKEVGEARPRRIRRKALKP